MSDEHEHEGPGGHGDRLEKGVSRLRSKEEECAHDEQPVLVRRFKRTRRVPLPNRPMRFRSLHHHSTYSFLDGYGLPEAHVRRATELNMDSLALTEHGNVSSHVKLEKEAKKVGIKPIFGVELYCGHIDERHSQVKNHLTILAETQEGYTNLLKLVGRTWSEGFYHKPTASGAMVTEHRKGLVVLSGCNSSLISTSLIGGKHVAPEHASYEKGRGVAQRFRDAFGDSYYLEVQAFPELESTRTINKGVAKISRELGIPMVASFDCHYTVPEESEIQAVLHNVRGGTRKDIDAQMQNWGYDVDLCPPWNDTMIVNKLIATGLTRQEAINAILASEEIAQRCNVEIPQLPMLRYPLPPGVNSARELLRDWLRTGWVRRGCDRMPADQQKKYRERLRYEDEMIESKDFVDYFLITADVVTWAKDHGILVGPARGSAAGSLVCWLLRITEVDPMLYDNLVFERFIDVSREDLPDIDLDFDSDMRELIGNYLEQKYGSECVNNIGTFATYKNKLALDDVARVFKIPQWEVDAVKDVLIERSSGDLRASATIEDTVEQFDSAREVFEKHAKLSLAMELEGNVKQMGIHAGGFVVSAGPVTDTCAVYTRSDSKGRERRVISVDKYDCEEKNLLKLDLLGLKNMSFLNACRQEMGWSLDDLYNLDLRDKAVIDAFRRNDVVGIFQYDGRACRYVCGALAPDTFEEICDIIALARPGPLHNGAANAYVDIKRGAMQPKLVHPAHDAITQGTYYQVVYQEQILRIVVEIGNFGWTHAAEIRRIMSKKTGEQTFNRKRDEFLAGAATLHKRSDWPKMDKDTADSIWKNCITAGAYAFNAAHTASYGIIGDWTQWFKQHETELFFAKALQFMAEKKHKDLIRDSHRGHGPRKPVEVKPPHPKHSTRTWRRDSEGGVRAGYEQFPGIGEVTSLNIMNYLSEHELEDWKDLQKIRGVGTKTIEKMLSFAKSDDPFGALWIDRAIAHVKNEILHGDLKDQVPYPTHVSADLPYSRGQDIEVVWLGVVKTRNVRDLFEFNQAKGKVLDMDNYILLPDGQRKWQPLLDGEPIKDPHLNEWMVMVADDESDQIGLQATRWKYPQLKNQLWDMRIGQDLLLVRGVKPGWMPTRQISINELWVIDPEM